MHPRPAAPTDDDHRYLASLRRRASRSLMDTALLQTIRQDAQLLAVQLLQDPVPDPTARASFLDPARSQNALEPCDEPRSSGSMADSHASTGSNQRAVLRGLHMGSLATRERRPTADSEDAQSEYATSTIETDPTTTLTSPLRDGILSNAQRDGERHRRAKRVRPWRRLRSKGTKSLASSSSVGTVGDAWMCGVCGRAFATFEACDRHEEWHIQTVCLDIVEDHDMGASNQRRATTDMAMGQSVASEDFSLFRSTRQRLFTEDESQVHHSVTHSRSERSIPPLHDLSRPWQRKHDDMDGCHNAWELDRGNVIEILSKQRTHHEVRFDECITDEDGQVDALLGSTAADGYVLLADEALVNVCHKALPLLLSQAELEAERNLLLLARDKAYYDDLALRAIGRRRNPYNRFRSEGNKMRDKIQNKLLDAYQIMKEGDKTRGVMDQYNKSITGDDKDLHAMKHGNNTLYVNVMVKNSVQVVKRELERLAKERWERSDTGGDENFTKFQRFRVYAHVNMVKLAGLALASDFTPRRIAIQLSNDLYRLMTPRLKRRGVLIETEIEYRVGGYFVLAVNINAIDWLRLLKANVVDEANRMKRWKRDEAQRAEDDKTTKFFWVVWYEYLRRVLNLTWFDMLSRAFSLLYRAHWSISIPLCWLAYHSPLATTVRMFILSSVTDEIFYYIEKKGMEMEIRVLQANSQASFMLQALREIRAGGRELKKKRQETEAQEVGIILGNLLGPSIKADKDPAPPLPDGFEMPDDLEFVSLEVMLPVGYRRLRWAMLNDESTFLTEAVMKTEAKYENISVNAWDRHSDYIGLAVLPEGVNSDDFVGISKEQEYLMPKSAFVSANMAYETVTITAYNDSCFVVKKKTRTPDVPFGSSFFSWTMLRFENLGGNMVKMTCSVEAEFPNGPPMIARQIQSGLRAGTAETFVSLGETITKYSEAFP